MRTIRIAQVIGRTLNGGVENYVLNYYLALDKEKYQFDFYVENESLVINKKKIEKMGGRVFIIPSIKKYFSYKKTLTKYFLENNYSIIQSNNNSLSAITLKIAEKCGIRVRIANSLSTSNNSEFLRNFLKKCLRKISKKHATHFFACSNLAGKWLFGNDIIFNNKYFLVHNAVDESKFVYSQEKNMELRKKYNIENKVVLGTIGRFEKQKNQLYLLDVFNRLVKRDDRFFLIIIGDGKLYNEIIEKIKIMDLRDKVLVLTSKQVGVRGSVANYYSVFDLFIMTSIYEGLPTVGIEAQINGLPCLFSSAITKETKINSNVEFMDLRDNFDKWISKIFELVGKRKFYNNYSEAFDINLQVRRLEMLYEDFLKDY